MSGGSFPVLVLSSVGLLLTCSVHGATYDNMQTLVTDLFSNYSKELRPFQYDTSPTYVYLAVRLVSIQDLDEVEQSLKISAMLNFGWCDNRLSWTDSDYNYTHHFAYPQKNLWIPDISVFNSVDSIDEMGFDRNYLYVSFDGSVSWLLTGVYKTFCEIDITYYPFDTQICKIVIATLVSSKDEIHLLLFDPTPADLGLYLESGTWDLVSFTAKNGTDPTGFKTMVVYSITIKRRTTYYVIAIIIPVLFLSFTSTLVFALPADSGEKMGTSITVLLAFAVYLSILSDQMPKTSLHVSIMSLFLSVLLGQTSLGVIMSVLILNLHFRDDKKQPPGQRMCMVAYYMQRLMCKIPKRAEVAPIDHIQDHPPDDTQRDSLDTSSAVFTIDSCEHFYEKEESSERKVKPLSSFAVSSDSWISRPGMMSWQEISYTFDRFMFYTFSAILVSFTFAFLIAVTTG